MELKKTGAYGLGGDNCVKKNNEGQQYSMCVEMGKKKICYI